MTVLWVMTVEAVRLGPMMIIMTSFTDVTVITVMSSELEIRDKDVRVEVF